MAEKSLLRVDKIAELYRDKILEVQEEPEFQWKKESIKYATDGDGGPSVNVAVGNVPLDYDL